jgi:SAM-dependent methyltransferase
MTDEIIDTIRENYDRLANEYANHLADELRHKPLDRELLARIARETKEQGEVCDLGCGPGHIGRYLHDLGANVFGLDLSPSMVEQARRLNPGIGFREGNMLGLDIPAKTLAGIVAFYAIVNLPRENLTQVFREMFRVLRPGGLLLIAFHIGDKAIRPDELWGQRVTMYFFLLPTADVIRALEQAGFAIEEVIERDPYPEVEYPSRRAYIFARRPAL